jgi:hypothetical protein
MEVLDRILGQWIRTLGSQIELTHDDVFVINFISFLSRISHKLTTYNFIE